MRAFVWAIQADIKITSDLQISNRIGLLIAMAAKQASRTHFVFVTRDGISTRILPEMPVAEI